MWRHEILRPKLWKGEICSWAQVKANGHRATVFVQESGQVLVHSSNSKPLSVDWMDGYRNLLRLPPQTSIDGELVIPDRPPSDVKTALVEQWPELVFNVFAIPCWHGRYMWHESLDFVEDLARSFGLHRFLPYEPVRQDVDYEQLAVDEGLEGFVLKQGNYSGWFKVKPTKTIDAVVTGFKDGNGKWLGCVGALKVSIQGREVASVSGMTDDIRLDIANNDIGRVCEVEYQNIGSKGRLIHPRFLRWRDDKSAGSCTLDQDPHLEMR